MTLHKSLLFSAAVITLLTGCGGSSDSDSNGFSGSSVTYTGVTTPATINSDNSEALAESSAAVTKSLTSSSSSDSLPFSIISNSQSNEIGKTIKSIVNQALENSTESSNLPTGISEVQNGNCGGTASGTGTENQFSVTFNDFCNNGTTINGTVSGSETDSSRSWNTNNISISSTDDTITFSGSSNCTKTETADTKTESCTQNIQATQNSVTSNVSFTEVCVENVSTGHNECTQIDYIQGDNGQTYQVEDSSVFGNNTSGWYASGTFYDPTHGSIDFRASNIQYCENGNIQSGSITLTDESNNTLSVTFNSCDEMTITLNGTATTVAQ